MITLVSHSLQETQRIGATLGRALHGGEVLELISDVGGGKTSFVKGLAEGLAIDDVVQSPTFTISRIYKARDGLELHHFDFYRLAEAGVVAAELAESLTQPNAIVAVEWGEIVHGVLPAQRLTLRIAALSETGRQLQFELPPGREDLAQALNDFKQTQKTA